MATMMMMSSVWEERPLDGADVEVAVGVVELARLAVGVAEADEGEDVEEGEEGEEGAFVSTTPATDCTTLIKESSGLAVEL